MVTKWLPHSSRLHMWMKQCLAEKRPPLPELDWDRNFFWESTFWKVPSQALIFHWPELGFVITPKTTNSEGKSLIDSGLIFWLKRRFSSLEEYLGTEEEGSSIEKEWAGLCLFACFLFGGDGSKGNKYCLLYKVSRSYLRNYQHLTFLILRISQAFPYLYISIRRCHL